MPSIVLSPQAELQLTAWSIATQGKEFSGLGLIEKNGDVFTVVDVFLLGVGSESYTEFNHERQRALGCDPRLKLWFHRHPIGSGNVGDRFNWSTTDETTATKEPMGVDPKLVQWSVAIVLTPGGWVGRVDLHVPKSKTFHCAVEPRFPTPETVDRAKDLITPDLQEYIEVLYGEYLALRNQRVKQSTYYSRYEFEDEWSYEPSAEQSEYFCSEPGCKNLAVALEEVYSEYVNEVEIKFFECPNCGQIYYFTQSTEYLQIGEAEERKSEPAWKQSFMKFLNKRR